MVDRAAGSSPGLLRQPQGSQPRHRLPAVLALPQGRRGFDPVLPAVLRLVDKASATTMVFPLLYFAGRTTRAATASSSPSIGTWSTSAATPQPPSRRSTSATPMPRATPRAFRPCSSGAAAASNAISPCSPVLVVPRRRQGSHHHRGRQLPAPHGRRRDHGRFLSALPLPPRRQARWQRRNQPHRLPALPLPQGCGNDLFASPVAAWTRSADKQAGFAGPYFWYRNKTFAARGIPLLYLDHTQLDTGERTRMWGPYVATDGPGHQARALFPLWAHYQNSQEQGTYIFPTFFRLRKNDGYRLDTFFPFVWLSSSPDAHTTVVGPYFTHHSPSGSSSGLLPFYVSAHTPKRDLLVTPLFLSHTNRQSGDSPNRFLALLPVEPGQRHVPHRAAAVVPEPRREQELGRWIPALLALRRPARRQVDDAGRAAVLGARGQRTNARPSAVGLVLARRAERLRQQRHPAALLRTPRADLANLANAPLRLQEHT
jgi:hypothetical protein